MSEIRSEGTAIADVATGVAVAEAPEADAPTTEVPITEIPVPEVPVPEIPGARARVPVEEAPVEAVPADLVTTPEPAPALVAAAEKPAASPVAGVLGAAAAVDLSGLEPVVERPRDEASSSPAGRSPRGGPARLIRGRSRRSSPPIPAGTRLAAGRRLPVPVPVLIALVVLVALAAVTVPLALRANHHDAELASNDFHVSAGASTAGASTDGAAPAGALPSAGDPAAAAAAGPGQDAAPAGGAQPAAGPAAGQQPGGDGAGAGDAGAGAPAGQVPAAPGLQTRAVSGGVEVTVTAPAGAAATSYVIAADPGGSRTLSAPGTVTIPVDGCARTTVTATAGNAAGRSAAATSTLVGCVAPSAPRGFTLTKLPPTASDPTGNIRIDWEAPAQAGGPGVVVDYVVRVYVTTDKGVVVNTYTVAGTSYGRNNPSGRDPYTKITIAARNPAGQSAEVIGFSGYGPTDTVGGES